MTLEPRYSRTAPQCVISYSAPSGNAQEPCKAEEGAGFFLALRFVTRRRLQRLILFVPKPRAHHNLTGEIDKIARDLPKICQATHLWRNQFERLAWRRDTPHLAIDSLAKKLCDCKAQSYAMRARLNAGESIPT